MKATVRNTTKWLLSLVFALVVISLILIPQVLKVESSADTYTRNTDWDYSSSTPHITCAGDLLQFVWLVNEGTSNFSGKTVYLDCDIDLNPNWSAAVSFSAGTGTGLANSTGNITLPSAPSTAWTNTMKSKTTGSADQPYTFNGTFDGQNHTISGIYYKRTSSAGAVCKNCGLLFNRTDGATIRNLAVLNSIVIWSENVGNSQVGFGGLVGGLAGGSSMSNVYAEVNVILMSTGHSMVAMGGICGWTSSNMTNCVYKGTMATTNGTDNPSYPAQNTAHHIGGVAGESEGGTQTDCIGITTFAVKESTVSLASSNQNTTTGGANQAIAGHYGSDKGTQTRVYAGAQNSAPSSSWRICSTLKSYAPKAAADIIADTSWFGAAGTYTLTTARQLLGYFELLATSTGFGGSTIKLGNSIDVNPGWDLNLNFNSSDQATIPKRPPKVVWTCDKKCTGTGFSGGRWNYGVFDGQGYVIRGLYSSMDENEAGSGFFGAFEGKDTQPAIQNLIIQNSYIQNTYDRQCNMSGLVTAFRGRATIQNVFIDIDLCARNSASYVSQIGAISNGGGGGQNTYTTVISNVVYAGTIANLNGRDVAIAGGKTNDRIAVTWQDPNSVKATVTDVLNMGSIFTNLSEVSDGTGTGFQNIGPNKSNITATRVQGKFYKKSQYPYKQTTNPGSWVWMPAYESYFPAGVANLQGFVKNGDINDLVTKVEAVKVNSANAYPLIAEGSVYTIDSVDEMKTFGNLVASCSESHSLNGILFKLTTDIDLNPAWDAHSEWTGTNASTWKIKFPEAASYYWPANKACFAGILDGDGHTLAGLYSTRLLTGQWQSNGGLFGSLQNTSNGGLTGKITSMRSARVSNLAITNSAVISIANSSSERNHAYLGGIAANMQWGATVNNCYIDMSVLIQTFNGTPFIGGVTGFTKALSHKPQNQIYDVVIASGAHIAGVGGNRSSIPKASDGFIGHTAEGPSARMAGLVGRTEGATIISRVLVLGAIHENFQWGSNPYVQDQLTAVSWSGGGDGTDCFNGSVKTSSVAAWSGTGKDGVALQTNQVSTLGTYTPCSVVPSLYAYTGTNVAVANFSHLYKRGSTFTIGNYSQYNTFVGKINADSDGSSYGKGYTFKITNDMNVNAAWRATGEYDWDGSSGTAEFSAVPENVWPVVTNFRGTLDGQGHLLEGLYVNYTTNGATNNLGLLFKNLDSGATVKNLLIRNSRMVVHASGEAHRVGGLTAYITGVNVSIQNIYLDVDIVVCGWSGQNVGGFVGGLSNNSIYLDNLMFHGRIAMAQPTSSNTYFNLPTSSSSTTYRVSELIGNAGWKTDLYVTNVILAGQRYGSATQLGYPKYEGANFYEGANAWGTKMRYDFVFLAEVPYTDADWVGTAQVPGCAYSSDWQTANMMKVGTYSPGSYLGTNIADALAYSTKLEMQVPTGIQAYLDAATFHNFDPVTTSIQNFVGNEISGSIFTIANADDLMYAVDLSQNGQTFSGYTLRLTANIDLNPGWDGHVTISSNTATLPNLPTNVFRGFKQFNGTFDGASYYIAGIFMMGTITNASFHLAPFMRTNGATIKRLKLTRGLILAMDNYPAPQESMKNFTDNKISGLVGRANGTTTIDSVYNNMEIWYDGFYGQYIGGFVAIVDSGVTVNINNVKFAGVLGAMSSSSGVKNVPCNSSATKLSNIIVNGGWSSKVSITRYNMNGTLYQSSTSATNAPPAVITAAANMTNVVTNGNAENGPGKATVGAPAAYVNRLATAFDKTVYANWTGGTTTYEGTHGTYVYNYQSIDFWGNYNAFASKLSEKGYTGYTMTASYRIGNNYYMLYENPNEYSLFVSFISTGDADESAWSKGRGSVFVSPAGTAYDESGSWTYNGGDRNNLTAPTSIPAANLCTAELWQLDVDNSWSTASGAMGYIMRLTNGHYIVIDGGYASEYDARHIYKILKEGNVLEGNPVIDAWFITHLHNDHFGALIKFASIFANNVDVKGFYYNFPSDTVAADADGDDEGINTENIYDVTFAMRAWPEAQLYSKVHAGQTFLFNGLNVTALATHESVSMKYYNGSAMTANSFYNGNDTSLVAKFTFFPGTSKEQSFMMNGDACEGISKFLSTAYANSDLEVDIIQVAHHGWKGLSADVYEMMDKSTSTANRKTIYLWPQDIISYSKTGSGNDTVWYYAPTTWDGHENQQGTKIGGNFGYMYTISRSNSLFGEANYFIRTRAKEVIPAYKDHCLSLPYRANTNYATNYWSNANIQSLYNAKKNNNGTRTDGTTKEVWDKWDGVASGQTASVAFAVKDWWNNGADSVYNIDTIMDFYSFVNYAKTQNFSGKTINLKCNVNLNSFDGTISLDGNGALIPPDDLNVWTPIPTFSGTFNGNNHTISGLYTYVTYNSNSAPYGGFIKTLAGGTVKDLAITKSAILFKNTAGYGSAAFTLGGIIGQVTGTATLQDCIFDVNIYMSTPATTSFAGVLGAAASGATANLTRVTFSGEIAPASAGWAKCAAVSLSSGQHFYGPVGFLSANNAGTVNLKDVTFAGTRLVPQQITGGQCFSADIYDAQHTGGTVNLSGTNHGGSTAGATPVAKPTESTQVAPTVATTTAPAYVYVPQYNKVVDAANSLILNPVYAQATDIVSSKTKVRIVGTITREAAKRALTLGFKLTITRSSDGKRTVVCTDQWDVFQTVTAADKTYTAQELGGEYLYAMVLTNLPASGTYTIEVQTRFRDQSEVEHFGAVATITVKNGVIQ